MKSVQKGFTLIELMIVVAIIAILAAIAIPAYQNYLIRSQVTEGFTLMDGAKVASTEYFANHGSFPSDNEAAGLPAAATSITGKYVKSVTVTGTGTGATADVTITAAFNTNANSAISKSELQMLGSIGNDSENIIWHCQPAIATGNTVDAKYLPSSCRP